MDSIALALVEELATSFALAVDLNDVRQTRALRQVLEMAFLRLTHDPEAHRRLENAWVLAKARAAKRVG